jgi:hypothetical protein
MRTSAMSRDDATRLAASYGVTLTSREAQLLTTDSDLLDIHDQQAAFLLREALAPLRCPACAEATCQRAAGTPLYDVDDHALHPDDAYQCHRCRTQLTWHRPFAGAPYFTITHPVAGRPGERQ